MAKTLTKPGPLTGPSDLDCAKAPLAETGPAAAAKTDPAGPARKTRAALVRDLVSAPSGASLSQLIAATGWQAHTLRAALSGLRKAGLTIERRRDGGETIYVALSPAKDGAATIAATIAAPSTPSAPAAEVSS
jgi:DNA-binding transcriptional ArsR family regulator